MPLPGGATDKVGNRYEGRWTVLSFTEVMAERADSIRLEPPGAEGEGVEFWVQRHDVREYHQVKRQLSDGRWTPAQLNQAGVLGNFQARLRSEDANCVFVSMYAADQLKELTDRARASVSFQEFRIEFLKSKDATNAFSTLRAYWGDCSESEAYGMLRRIHVRTLDERSLQEFVRLQIETLVEGDPGAVEASLAQLALDQVHDELTAFDIWKHLASQGYGRRQWSNDRTVLAAVEAANGRYLRSFPDPTIGGRLIQRAEADQILSTIDLKGDAPGVALVGEAGVGKSGVMRQLLSALEGRGIPFLALRVDRLQPVQLVRDLGCQLGLPGSPAAALAAVAQGRECVLVVDQLDAVSLASGRRTELFDPVAELARQAAHLPNVFLVLSCRKFDLDNDHRLRDLVRKQGVAQEMQVGRLSEATVRDTVTGLGLDARRLTASQVKLLEVPLHLSLLAEIAPDPSRDPLGFETVTDLYDRFWDRKQRLLLERRGGPVPQWVTIMDRLTSYMSDHQSLTAPKWVVDEFEPDLHAVVSEHVVAEDDDGHRLAFFHDGFFDYVFARRFLAQGGDLMEMLCRGEQGLFRRAQVRQILAYERDRDRTQYLADLRAILGSDRVRPHLKDVVLSLLAQLRDPTWEEWEVLEPMTASNCPLAVRAWGTLHGSPGWIRLLDGHGLFKLWLGDQEAVRVNRAVWLLASVLEDLPDRVADLVEPYVGASEEWNQRLRSLVQHLEPGMGRRFFDLFLRAIDEGILDVEAGTGDR
ncbi:MAG: ATP-binding protein [Chloroflexota bacterium]|nr:ATP-binding protein [Chloroflexota bacterium]